MGKILIVKVGSTPLQVHVSHAQSVLRLPDDAKLLASSDMDPHQAFVVGSSAWGVQFHPEFDVEITVEYINHFGQELRDEKQDPERLIQGCVDTPCGPEILERFVKIAQRA
jgi:GMP synthase (glutamine-hydrolysing)